MKRTRRSSPSLPRLPVRRRDAHKGDFGRVLVVGGSVGMAGAPALVGLAALRSGAGLVTIAVPTLVQDVVAGLCPCATTIGLPATDFGRVAFAAAEKLLHSRGLIGGGAEASPPDVLVIGPGLGTGSRQEARQLWKLIDAFRDTSAVPCVIDADALNMAALIDRPAADRWDTRPHPRTIITPHPGELGRWQGTSAGAIQSRREHYARDTARRMNAALPRSKRASSTRSGDAAEPAVVILKGAGTIITDGRKCHINDTGNPGMATGGSGDALAGILGGLIGAGYRGDAQNGKSHRRDAGATRSHERTLSLYDAAVLATHLHGRAGDLAAQHLGQTSLIATDMIDCLPTAILEHARGTLSRRY